MELGLESGLLVIYILVQDKWKGYFFLYILQVSNLETLTSPRVLVYKMNALSQVDKHKKTGKRRNQKNFKTQARGGIDYFQPHCTSETLLVKIEQ